MDKNQHEGHRDRLKNRYLNDGLDNFELHNVLELMLFYAKPQIDTNVLAHTLIETFGSFSGVLDATVGDLVKVKGITMSVALYIKMFVDVYRKYSQDLVTNMKIFDGIEAFGKFLLPQFIGRRNEMVILMCLDGKMKLLATHVIFEGNVNAAQMSIKKVVEYVLRYNAVSVVIAHNHPSGLALPSQKDMQTTHKINTVLNYMGIRLLDHLIFADDDYVSFHQSGLLKQNDIERDAAYYAVTKDLDVYSPDNDILKNEAAEQNKTTGDSKWQILK